MQNTSWSKAVVTAFITFSGKTWYKLLAQPKWNKYVI